MIIVYFSLDEVKHIFLHWVFTLASHIEAVKSSSCKDFVRGIFSPQVIPAVPVAFKQGCRRSIGSGGLSLQTPYNFQI